jgi:hypothetical protein
MHNILNGIDQKTSDIKDRRVGPGKLENWKRRYKKEPSISGSLPSGQANLVCKFLPFGHHIGSSC